MNEVEWRALPGGPSAWRSQAKLRDSLGRIAATVSSEVRTKMAENRTQDGRFKGQFEKMEVLPLFSQLNQAFSFRIVFWDWKLISNGNWGKLGPFQTTKNKDRSKKVTYALFPLRPSIIQKWNVLNTMSQYRWKSYCVNPETKEGHWKFLGGGGF